MVIDVFIESSGILLKEGAHVANMRDRDPNFADFAASERMVAVETGLGRQVKGNRKAGLSLGQVLSIEPIGFARGRMAGVGAEDPRLIPTRPQSFARSP